MEHMNRGRMAGKPHYTRCNSYALASCGVVFLFEQKILGDLLGGQVYNRAVRRAGCILTHGTRHL